MYGNRGLNPHIEDIARRLALAMAFAPDALTRSEVSGDDNQGGQLFAKVDTAKSWKISSPQRSGSRRAPTARVRARFLLRRGIAIRSLSAPGPIWACRRSTGATAGADIPKIKAAILVQPGALDTRLAEHSRRPVALKAANTHDGYVYPAVHGFNDATPERYNKAAAVSRGSARSTGSTNTWA